MSFDNNTTASIFQFHKGTIRTGEEPSRLIELNNFNSIKVRLEPTSFSCEAREAYNFNSIKVRLEHGGGNHCFGRLLFQFHKGTIRTLLEIADAAQMPFYFNSIKVRLELLEKQEGIEIEEFQFHKGTIRTIRAADCRKLRQLISIP